MRRVTLRTGETIPQLGLGTWHMGEQRSQRGTEADALKLGLDLGMTLIDTAEMYGEGGAEEVVAEAVKGRRDEAFIVSKVYPHNASKAGAIAACERSLERLKTDRIDLYLLHWRGSYPLAETVGAFEKLKADGKIRHWGVSNLDCDDLDELAGVPNGKSCVSNQVLYHLGARGIDFDLIQQCADDKIMVMAYSPLGQGRILRNAALAKVAARHGVSPAAVALAWTMRHPHVVAIPKAAELRRIVDAARGSPEALAVAAAHAARERASPEPPSDGALAPESGAPEPHSLTAPLPLMLAPSPPSWPAVAPPLRTDTVRLGPPDGPRRRRRGAAVTTALVVAAVVALGVVSAGESSSRAALDWSPLGLGAPAATPADEVPGARVAASHPDDDPRGLAPASAPARVEATSVEAGRVEPASLAPAALEGGASVDPATALEPPSSATAPSSADATPPASSADPTPPAPSDPAPSDVAAAPRRAADPAPALPEPGAGAAPRAPSPEPAAAPARARAPEPVSRPPRRPGPPRASGAAGAARSDVARLTVTASAPAAVLIDGVPYGTTPLQSIPVEPGTHEVAFIQDGKRSAERLTIRSGEHKRVEAASARPPSDGLDEAAVKRTIKRNRAAVVDGCWDHAFDSSSPGAPTSVRVPVTVNVEPSGVVRSVATEAEPPGYPALRRCVEDRVAAWRFPSARADTVVTVAFVFVLR